MTIKLDTLKNMIFSPIFKILINVISYLKAKPVPRSVNALTKYPALYLHYVK